MTNDGRSFIEKSSQMGQSSTLPSGFESRTNAADFSGGDRTIPAISIKVFYERSETAQIVKTAASDRRMKQASLECIAGGLSTAIEYLSANITPNLLIIESNLPSNEMLTQIDILAQYCDSDVEIMVIGAVNDIVLYRELMARGVSEYLVPPLQPLQLLRAISKLFSNPETPFLGRSIATIGAKGGVGSSTIAHNLAWAIAENIKLNTTLMDLDLSFGTTALDFNRDGPQSVADALLAPERADQAIIARLLTPATERLSLFTAPATVSQEFDISPEAFDTVIQAVRNTVSHLVLDLPHSWNSWVKDSLVSADEVILVCQPDLASLRNGKNLIDRLKSERPNDSAPHLVMNMVGIPKRPEVPLKDFATAIGVQPTLVIPYDPTVFGTATNNGQMISEYQPESKSALLMDELAGLMTGKTAQTEKKSFLQKLLRR